jgi:riboflavin-specific deaminase-like protein
MTGLPLGEWRRLLDMAERARAVRSRTALDEDAGRRRAEFLDAHQQLCAALAHPLSRDVYAPLIAHIALGPLTVAQVGQSLDGRIATESGHSQYVSGEEGLDHLHRLRALADAVVVGASTVVLDDPQLTTRRVEGPNAVRVVIDPNGRVPPERRVFDGQTPTVLLRSTTGRRSSDRAGGPSVIVIEREGGVLPPRRILEVLHARDLLAVLIEGGGRTISAFLSDDQVNRLHVVVAPLLIGPGRSAFLWPAIDRLDHARRFKMTAHPLGDDVLFDCILGAGSPARPSTNSTWPRAP